MHSKEKGRFSISYTGDILRSLFTIIMIYRNIKPKKNEWYFILNHHLGDAFLFCSYLRKFKEMNSNPKINLLANESTIGVRSYFDDYFNFELLEELPHNTGIFSDILFLLNFGLRPGRIQPSGALYISTIRKGSFHQLDMYNRQALFLGLDENNKMLAIVTRSSAIPETIRDKFTSLKLKPGRTIILAPYSKSMAKIDFKWWENIRDEAFARGYMVATNLSPKETEITGTVPLFMKIGEILDIAELSGYVISARSGFCDIVLSANCKLAILYNPSTPEDFYIKKKSDNESLCKFNGFIAYDKFMKETISKIFEFFDTD